MIDRIPLKDHGRQVIFSGENPMQAEDIPSLVPWLINDEVYSPENNRASVPGASVCYFPYCVPKMTE